MRATTAVLLLVLLALSAAAVHALHVRADDDQLSGSEIELEDTNEMTDNLWQFSPLVRCTQ
jgi:hypothetical protein